MKRQTLILESLARTRFPVTVFFAGAFDDSQTQRQCEQLVEQFGLAQRVRFLGSVPEEEKIRLYAESRGVIFVPVDEDYGYVTLEAMLSAKPVLTCTDSGGPLEFLIHGETGLVVEPSPDAVAEGLDRLWADNGRACRWGQTGRRRYDDLNISWENVVRCLVA